MDSASIARNDILLKEMAAIQLANEKRVAQAQKITGAAAAFDEAAVVAAAKQQLAQQLQDAAAVAATAADEAGILTDTAGRYKDLFAGIDEAAAKNPSDLVAQYQKALKDGFVAQAEAHKAEIAAATKAVTDQQGVFTVDVKPTPLPPVIQPQV
jgi:hypothetical protein